MVTFTKNRWNSDFQYGNFTSDQLERLKEGIRDDMAGRHESVMVVRHVHETPGYVRGYSCASKVGNGVMDPEDQARDDAKRNEILLEWKEWKKKKADKQQAKKHLELAPKTGHSDAQEKLKSISGDKTSATAEVPNQPSRDLKFVPEFPKVKCFQITEIVLEGGVSGYLLQIEVAGRKGFQPISAVLKQYGRCYRDVFSDWRQARDIGLKVKKNGLGAF